MSKITELGEIDLKDNEQLKDFLQRLRNICYELYIDVSWSADILQSRLANIRGVKNTVRARVIAAALRTVAESFKIAGAGTVKVWTRFENSFAEELATSKVKDREEFKIK